MNHYKVLYSCNHNYLDQTLASCNSLLQTNPGAEITWVTDGFTASDNAKVRRQFIAWNSTCRLIPIVEIIGRRVLKTDQSHAKTIYIKLFVDILYQDEKVLYLDSDTIVTSDLQMLFDLDLSDNILAGVVMPYSLITKSQMGLNPIFPYICDGVVLINTTLWKKYNCFQKSMEYIEQFHGYSPMQSESALNYACEGKIKVIPPKFNLMPMIILYKTEQIKKMYNIDIYYTEEERVDALMSPKIIHYVRELYNRPWFIPCMNPYRHYYIDNNKQLIMPKQLIWRTPSLHTEITKMAFHILPFQMFCMLFQKKHNWMFGKENEK